MAEPPRQRIWPWAVGALFAALLLALQGVHHFRVELAVAAPEMKPLLLELCDALACELPLPSKAELIGIESSDLHPDAQKPGRLQLAATLKNRAPHAQQYPHLELALTDTNDAVLLRRVLAPDDYLPKSKPAAAGFAAGGDLAVSLALEVKDLAPVGYRLYVFYP
jgi:hypothetical protein